VEINDIFGKAV
jgi:hypothetical protein